MKRKDKNIKKEEIDYKKKDRLNEQNILKKKG